MKRAIYPGSFDPITNGHIDIAERALRMFDEVVIAVAKNAQKSPTFAIEERMELVRQWAHEAGYGERLKVETFEGLLVNFAVERGACALVRGLRAVSDFEFEFQLALMNRKLNPEVETIFLMPREDYVYLNSRIVREIFSLGGKIGDFVPKHVIAALEKKLKVKAA